MLFAFLRYFWSLRGQFIKYFIVGISSLALDMSSLILLKEGLDIKPVTAVVINQVFLLAYNFTLNKYWSFHNKALPHRQIVRYLTLAGFNYAFSVAAMYLFNHILGLDYRLIRLASIAVMVSWNFFLYKYWIYQGSKFSHGQAAIAP